MTERARIEARRIIDDLMTQGWSESRIIAAFPDGAAGVSGNDFIGLVKSLEASRGFREASNGLHGVVTTQRALQLSDFRDIDEFITYSEIFSSKDIYIEFNVRSPADRKKIRNKLDKLVQNGTLERAGKPGHFRKVDRESNIMDLSGDIEEGVDLILPTGLHDVVNIPQGGIVIVSGTRNSGKTAFLLNVAADNRDMWNVQFLNSESSEAQLKKRLREFERLEYDAVPREEFIEKVVFKKRFSDFHDEIEPGERNLNVIDYLTMYDEHYKIAGKINQIYKKMDGKGITFVGLQLPEKRDYATGGEATLDVACLYILIRHNEITLRKVKDFKGTKNPEGQTMKFKLYRGTAFYPQSEWDIGGDSYNFLEDESDDIPWQ